MPRLHWQQIVAPAINCRPATFCRQCGQGFKFPRTFYRRDITTASTWYASNAMISLDQLHPLTITTMTTVCHDSKWVLSCKCEQKYESSIKTALIISLPEIIYHNGIVVVVIISAWKWKKTDKITNYITRTIVLMTSIEDLVALVISCTKIKTRTEPERGSHLTDILWTDLLTH